MPPDAPGWWYPDADHGISTGDQILPWLLSPAAALYAAATRSRMARKPQYRSALPVICVGNFTAGGTGKTPLAIALAQRLRALGAAPAFLTRGYRGSVPGPYDVLPARDTADRVGDEPLLLAAAAPTVVCRDRVQGARHIERSDADVIIMDDGLQNPALAKDLTFAVVDGRRGFGNGWTIPSGPLRAPVASQRDFVDAIVVNGVGPDDQMLTTLRSGSSKALLQGQVVPAAGAAQLNGIDVIAFSGIGNPERFDRLLEDRGARMLTHHRFGDHHAFSDDDASTVLKDATDDQVMVVTTEKDLARLRGAKSGSPRAKLLERSYAIPVTFTFNTPDSDRLDALLDVIVRKPRSQ